jgi:hypothetical protein
MRVWLASVFLFFGMSLIAQAQEKCRWFPADFFAQPAELDSLSAIEQSIRVVDKTGKTYPFTYALSNRTLQINFDPSSKPDSVQVCYRTLAIRLDQTFAKRTLMEDYDSTAIFKDNRIQSLPDFDIREELFPSTNLYKPEA